MPASLLTLVQFGPQAPHRRPTRRRHIWASSASGGASPALPRTAPPSKRGEGGAVPRRACHASGQQVALGLPRHPANAASSPASLRASLAHDASAALRLIELALRLEQASGARGPRGPLTPPSRCYCALAGAEATDRRSSPTLATGSSGCSKATCANAWLTVSSRRAQCFVRYSVPLFAGLGGGEGSSLVAADGDRSAARAGTRWRAWRPRTLACRRVAKRVALTDVLKPSEARRMSPAKRESKADGSAQMGRVGPT